mgnify:FL=1
MIKELDNLTRMTLKLIVLEASIGGVKAKVHTSFFMKKSKKHLLDLNSIL